MKYIIMSLASVLAVTFIIQLVRGSQYDSAVEGLDENDYPLHDLYVVGLAWAQTALFRLKGQKADELKKDAGLLYETHYAEYYANVIWAQIITYVHLILSLTFLLAALFYDAHNFLIVVGLITSVITYVYFMKNIGTRIQDRTVECEEEFPEIVSTMAILVNSGMVLKEAWQIIADSGEGVFYELMQKASDDMNNGMSDMDAIVKFAKESNSNDIKKFASALLQSMEKGGGELGEFLSHQSSELWNEKRQRMLQKGEQAATKLLAPIVLIFLGVIIIVITAAFAGALF